MAILLAEDLVPDRFQQLIENQSWPQETIIMAFSAAEARFAGYQPDRDRDFIAASDQGRLFAEHGELRWRRIDSLFRVVYLGDPPEQPLNLADHSTELAGHRASERCYPLWGVRTGLRSEWLEQQVPHRFAYPINTQDFPNGRVGLVVEEWADKAGIPRFARYVSLTEWEGEQNHAAG